MFLQLVINFALASKLAEYRFGINFGQVFFDYSGNLNLAVNGESSANTLSDTVGSAKGVYVNFSPMKYITLPSNDVASSMQLIPPYSLLTWTRMKEASYSTLFYRGVDINNYYTIETDLNGLGLWLKVVVNSVNYIGSSIDFSTCCKGIIYLGNWSLISLSIQGNTFRISVNGVLLISLALSQNYQDPPGINKMFIGNTPIDSLTTSGLIWNFILLSGLPDLTLYYSGASSVCLSSGSCNSASCSPSIIDPDYGVGCLNTNICGVQGTSSCGWIRGLSCSSSPCFSCTCASKSCKIVNGAVECLTICSPGFYFYQGICFACNLDCKNCLSDNLCVSCKAENSIPSGIQGCVCNIGYYNETALTSVNSCIACNPDCIDCKEANLCLSCKDVNALPSSTLGCECKSKFYYNSSHICDGCHSDCATCNTIDLCITCKDINALPSNTVGCVCALGFYFNTTYMNCSSCGINCSNCSSYGTCNQCVQNNMYSNECLLCDSSCATCSGSSFYDCSSCNYTRLNGVCFDKCPVGYVSYNKSCQLVSTSTAIFKFDFQEVGSVFHDTINGFEAVASTKKRNLQQSMIQSVYKRGIYFPGSVPLLLNTSHSRLFGDSFSISCWINPESVNGTVISKIFTNQTVFQVYFINLTMIINMTLNSNQTIFNSSNTLTLNAWNHLLFTVKYSNHTNISISVNRKTTSFENISKAPFVDNPNSLTFVGADGQFNNSFQGFMYTLEAYPRIMTPEDFLNSTSCIGFCSICPMNSVCIPFCPLNQFYSESAHMCSNCPNNCSTTCKSATECSLCADSYCDACSSFETKSCTMCISGYELVNNLCSPCDITAYYNSTTKLCNQCVGLCTNCLSETNCTGCFENSRLNDNNECVCRESFVLQNNACNRVSFFAKIMISEENVATIIFEQPLKNAITKSDIIVQIDGKLYPYDLIEVDNSTYKITPLIDSSVKDRSVLNVTFVSEISSLYGFSLGTTQLVGKLFITQQLLEQKATIEKAAKAKKLAGQGTTAGAFAALGISLLNFNPASFFDFLNTAEMFYSVYLFNLDLHPVLAEFLVGMRLGGSLVPNIFALAFDESEGVPLNSKFKKFGYNTNLVFLNCGLQLMTLIFFLILMILLLPLSRFKWWKKKLKSVFESFKYGVFLRFWLQTSFEFLTACSVGIKFSNFENATQIIDYSFCIIFILAEVLCLILLIYVIKARSKLRNEELIKEYKSMYSTFFEEFKDIGVSRWLFYLIYILRRSVLILCYNFISDGHLQISISLIFSLAIPVYLLATSSFENNLFNIYHFFNELTIAAFNCVLLVTFLNGTSYSSEAGANLCLNFITVAWAMNIAASIYGTTTSIISKVRNYLKRRHERKILQTYSNNTKTDSATSKNKSSASDIDLPSIKISQF